MPSLIGEPPRAVAGRVRRAARTAGAVATEIGWIGAHLTRYPWGLLGDSLSRVDRRRVEAGHSLAGLTQLQRGAVAGDVTASCTPIVLVHGIGDNHTIFSALSAQLRRRGFTSLWTFDYPLRTADVRATARHLGEAIQRLVQRSGYERVHVIGHSLGGLVARYHVQRQGGDAYVDTLITLGTPHQGTDMARLAAVLPLVGQLTPGSEVIAELREPAPGCRTRFVALYSEVDHLIVPSWRGRIDHGDLDHHNLPMPYVGHMSLTNNGTVAHTIATTLRNPRPE